VFVFIIHQLTGELKMNVWSTLTLITRARHSHPVLILRLLHVKDVVYTAKKV